MSNDLEQKLKVLKIGYLKKLEASVLDFETILENDAVNVEELYSKVHTISGTSGMYGIGNLSDISTVFEIYLKDIRSGAVNLDNSQLKQKLNVYLTDLKSILSGELND